MGEIYYVYVYLDPRKKGVYVYDDLVFEYEPFYVGKGHGDRKNDHIKKIGYKDKSSRNRHKVNKIKNILDNGFNPIVLILYENLSEIDSLNMEVLTIGKIGRRDLGNGSLCNMTSGGEGLRGASVETRDKISNSNKGKTAWNKGKTGIYSKETIQRLSEATSRLKKGIPRTLYEKQCISKRHKNKVVSIDTREKLSKSHKGQTAWNKGKIMSDECRLKNSISHSGEKHHNWGKKLAESTIEKMRVKAFEREAKKREKIKIKYMKHILVLGGGGFIGSHIAKRLKSEGHWVRVVDIKRNEYLSESEFCNEFIQADLTDPLVVSRIMFGPNQHKAYEKEHAFDEVYQLAANMGGSLFIFTGENDVEVMHDSALINLNVAHEACNKGVKKLFYSSSACIYPAHNQEDPNNPNCKESSAYPADPDSEYGFEKLFSERLYKAYARNKGLNVRIARFHNIMGIYGTWRGGKEKAPAAMMRKVIETPNGGEIEVWGKGDQSRSFLYIDECVEAVLRLMDSDCTEILNIGSEEMVSINQLAQMCIDISGKNITIRNIDGDEYFQKYGTKCPRGVNGRNSDNTLYKQCIGWSVSQPLIDGLRMTYPWIEEQYKKYQEQNKNS